MELDPPSNPNYCATVVRVPAVVPLDNCDNVVAVPIFGYQAITSTGIEVGDLRVLFTAETQLSEEYVKQNNLYRHGDRNQDPDKKGYLDDNRRIKALKFRGHRSDALLMPLESLSEFCNPDDLNEGDVFDKINGTEICKKYAIKARGTGVRSTAIKAARIGDRLFPKHFDTENYFRNVDKLQPNDYIYVTQKLHGTSIRVANTLVTRKLSWVEKVIRWLGYPVQETVYDYVFGSRNVIKDSNDPSQSHFYDTDIYTLEGKKLEGRLPKGVMVYGELIGWTPDGTPLQKDYTYDVPEGLRDLYVYRVVTINPDGQTFDLAWPVVKDLCAAIGLRHVPELWNGFHRDLNIEDFLDIRHMVHFREAVDSRGPVDEGVCIRRDDRTPLILKAKSPEFLRHETKLLDKGIESIEEA